MAIICDGCDLKIATQLDIWHLHGPRPEHNHQFCPACAGKIYASFKIAIESKTYNEINPGFAEIDPHNGDNDGPLEGALSPEDLAKLGLLE